MPVDGTAVGSRHDDLLVRQYGLRWSVLAAWRDSLLTRGSRIGVPGEDALRRARIKISSGCFSPCEIGCDLATAEAALTSAESSLDGCGAFDFWVELLGHAMRAPRDAERLLRIPAVEVRFAECRLGGCRCD